MEKELRNRLLELGLRAHGAAEHFRDADTRNQALAESDRVPIKDEIAEANLKTLEFLNEARTRLAEDGSGKGVVPFVQLANPFVHQLEAAVGALKTAVLDAETRAAIRSYRGDDIPAEPFDLRPGMRVTDVALFRKMLEMDIQGGPRWRMGALLSDLRDLLRVSTRSA